MNANYSYRSMVGPWPLAVNTADTIQPGMLLAWDSVSKTFRPLADGANGELFAGIALGQHPLTGLDNDQYPVSGVTPQVEASVDGLHSITATNGETYTMGDALYASTAAGNGLVVTKTAPAGAVAADIVGYFWPDDGADLAVADATTKIQVRIRINWPTNKLA